MSSDAKFHEHKKSACYSFIPLISMGNLINFVVWLLNNWLVNVVETFTDILKYYGLHTIANKFAKCML